MQSMIPEVLIANAKCAFINLTYGEDEVLRGDFEVIDTV